MDTPFRFLGLALLAALVSTSGQAAAPRACTLHDRKPNISVVKSVNWTADNKAMAVDFQGKPHSGGVIATDDSLGDINYGERVNVYFQGELFPGSNALELLFLPQRKKGEYIATGVFYRVRGSEKFIHSIVPPTDATCTGG